MSWFGGSERRFARAVVDEQRRQARADREVAEGAACAVEARRLRREATAQRRAADAAQLERDRQRAADYDAVVAADALDDLARQAEHDDHAGMTTSGRMLRMMRAEQVEQALDVDGSRWLPAGARPPRPSGRLHPALRRPGR